VSDIELVELDIMEEHIDTAEVVRGQVNFLAIEALADIGSAQDFSRFKEERARATGRVIDLIDRGFADDRDAREQFRDLLRGEELAPAFASVGSVHAHEELIGITEGVNGVILVIAEIHAGDAIHEFDEQFIALDDGRAELVAVEVKVIKETREVFFTARAFGGLFNMVEDVL
jgi:hypothetical protein